MKKYKIKYQNNDLIEEIYIETTNLSNEKLPKNILEIKEQKKNFEFLLKRKKRIKKKDLNLLFYELSLMLNSKINLTDSIDILIKNKKDKNLIEFLKILKYSFANGKSVRENLGDFDIDNVIISFLENLQNSGNSLLNLKALNSLLKENEEIKKSFFKALSYPIILSIALFSSLFAIFTFVLPKFKTIFLNVQTELPIATRILLFFDDFFQNYFLIFLIILSSLFFLLLYFYKSSDRFQRYLEKIIVENLFMIKDIYLSMQFYKFFLVIDIMLKSNYEFHKALISSKILLKNKYLLDKISIIDTSLQNGKSINESFFRTKIFDDIVLNLINTGEVTNSLDVTIYEIKEIYKNRFYEKTNLLISFIQPIFLLIIMGLILWIVLGIFLPIWDMGNIINL
jgi:general secretion pathway protein F